MKIKKILPVLLLFVASSTYSVALEVAGYTFSAPKEWKSVPPSSNMRKAQFEVSGQSGGKADVVFFHFGSGGAGGVQANVDRWMKQFEVPLEKKVQTETLEGIKVTYAQAHGTFLSGRPFGPKTPNPGFALMAAIIEGKQGAIFIKMTGPKETVETNSDLVKKMVGSSLKK
ncbi:MAG: hypothetical protein CMI27_04250 [Opitutae bacterium]|nr:hypothetical protein [Opitutae bacterium]